MHRRPFALLATAASAPTAALLLLEPSIAHASEGGLQIIPSLDRLIPLLVLFVILVPVLNALLFKPLLAVLEEREQSIDGARARAAELAQQAGALLARHDEAVRRAREIAHAEQVRVIDEARGQHAATIGAARETAEAEIVRARGEIASATQSVRATLAAEAEPIARDIAARLLDRSLS
jgi:F-type H+-transporting ATPase subunit b